MSARRTGRGATLRILIGLSGPTLAVALVTILLGAPMLGAGYGNAYDEGISLSAGTFITHGLVPYRDFWLLYGPGSAYAAAATIEVFGRNLVAFRLAALMLVGVQASLGYLLARRLTSPLPAVVLATSAAVIPFLLAIPNINAWSLAMLAATSGLLAADRRGGLARFVAGSLIGLAFLCRLDLGGYALVAALIAWRDRRLLLGFAAVAVPAITLFTILVPVQDLYTQLLQYPLLLQPQFRGIPMSMPWGSAPLSAGPLGVYLVVALWYVPLLAIASGLYVVARGRETPAIAMALVVFALLSRLQGLERADVAHEAQVLTPAWLLIGMWLPGAWRPSWPRRMLLIALIPAALTPVIGAVVGLTAPRPSYDVQLDQTVAYIRQRTTRTQGIFVGLANNRFAQWNPLLAYFLADRPPAAVDSMYNPGFTNTEQTERAIAADLERTACPYLLLDRAWAGVFEMTNNSRIAGPTTLDAYIQEHYRPVLSLTYFLVMERVPGGSGTIRSADLAAIPTVWPRTTTSDRAADP